MKREIGSGKYSTVREAINIKTGQFVAVKCVKRADMPEEAEVSLRREIEILKNVDHRNIVKLNAVYVEPHFTYLVLECLTGGELFDGIVRKKFFPEVECRKTIHSILSALAYLHAHHIIHRGLKPEKLILSAPNRGVLKLCGFGDACYDTIGRGGDGDSTYDADVDMNTDSPSNIELSLQSLSGHQTVLGTRGYASPEMLSGLPYGDKVDMWSAGVILYILLCGYPPFMDTDPKILEQRIKNGVVVFNEKYWSRISDNAKNLVAALLVTNADERISSQDALNHPWFSLYNS